MALVSCVPVKTGFGDMSLNVHPLIEQSAQGALDDMKSQLGSVEQWKRLLKAAPATFTALSFCYVTAQLVKPGEFPQKYKPKDEKITIPGDLKSCLQSCYDDGVVAFNTAKYNMNELALSIKMICEPGGILEQIDTILASIHQLFTEDQDADIDKVKENLRAAFQQLIGATVKCVGDAAEVSRKFNDLHAFTTAVNQAYLEVDNAQDKTWSKFTKFMSKPNEVSAEELQEFQGIFSPDGEKVATNTAELLKCSLISLSDIKHNLDLYCNFFQKLKDEISIVATHRIPNIMEKAKNEDALRTEMKVIFMNMMNIRVCYMLSGIKSNIYNTTADTIIEPCLQEIADLKRERRSNLQQKIAGIMKISKKAEDDIKTVMKDARVPSYCQAIA